MHEIKEDNVSNGAAALAYYLILSIFPAMIVLLSILPYLPIPHLDSQIMDLLRQALPGEAASMFENVVREVTSRPQGGLLSFGLLFTFWAASNGMYAIMQQLNMTYDVVEGRPFWKTRGTALLLTFLFGVLIVGAFALIVFGGGLEDWMTHHLHWTRTVTILFAVVRWSIIVEAVLLGFALTYYLGPDVEQKFRFITPGSILGALVLLAASLGFKLYVSHFGNYAKTYGSIGAVIILLVWLYIAGIVLLLGSEINALIEHYSPEGKDKGEKKEAA